MLRIVCKNGCTSLTEFTMYTICHFLRISDGNEFIPSEWNGTYVCPDDHLNISYILNISKSDSSIGTLATLILGSHSEGMTGTFASFGKLLALQGYQVVSQLIYGNNFTKVEINMKYDTILTMVGALVFMEDDGSIKTCPSELHRNSGNFDD